MERITQDTELEDVEYVYGSGVGILDFAVKDDDYYQWLGSEEAEWIIEDVDYVENADTDRFFIYPEGDHFICEIMADSEEENEGPVHCWCE